jgi:prepilin-type N-terminal cleavage/methylation domain-containing protein
MKINNKRGFTLLEILLVIAAIGILAAIVLIAINPNRQLAQARNAERRSEVNAIYKALEQYTIDNRGYPSGITTTLQNICNTGSEQVGGATNCSGSVDLRVLVPTYLAAIPVDPSGTVYSIALNSTNNRISVQSSSSELGQTIGINSLPAATDPFFSNVSLLLKFNGTNGSTTFVDSKNGFPITPVGNAQISTAQSRWDGASGLFDGNGDYLNIATNSAFDFGTGDFTVEAWVYPLGILGDWFIASAASTGGLFFGYTNSQGPVGWGIGRANIAWDFLSGALTTTNTWYHLAVSRSGTNVRFFVDGVQVGATSTNSQSYNISTGGLNIGSQGPALYLNGYIDELRITKGVARYTTNFTPATQAFPTN